MAAFPSSLIGQTLTYREVEKRARKALRPFKFTVSVKPDVEFFTKHKLLKTKRKVYFSGYYDADLTRQLVVNVLCHPERSDLTFSRAFREQFLFQLFSTIQHELLHKKQFSKLKKKTDFFVPFEAPKTISLSRNEEIDYYRRWVELDCYAQDIAMEINYNVDLTHKESMRMINSIPKRLVPSYHRYRKAFRGLDWTELRHILLKRVARYLPTTVLPVSFDT